MSTQHDETEVSPERTVSPALAKDEPRRQTDDFSKDVEYVAKDDEQQVAYGATMVPGELDLQGDFIRAGALMEAAAGFSERVTDGDAHLGVMHCVFPGEEHVELDEARILQSAETLGGETFPAGTWVQGHKYHDDELWGLVTDGVISGFSVGGTIEEEIWYSPGETAPDDITVPDAVQEYLGEHDSDADEIDIREIVDIRMLETSSVDHPAVPRALHREHKSADFAEKAHPALTENVVESRNYLEARGHTEDEALRLAEYLNRAKEAHDDSWIARARRYFSRGSDDGGAANELPSDESADTDTADAALIENMDEDEFNDSIGTLEAQNEEIKESLGTIAEALSDDDGGEEKSVGDMEAAEFKSVMTEAVKEAAGSEEEPEAPTAEELMEQTHQLAKNQEQLAEMFQRMNEAAGGSQQTTETAAGGEAGSEKARFILGGD